MSQERRHIRTVHVYEESYSHSSHDHDKHELQRQARAERERGDRYKQALIEQKQKQERLEDELINRMNGCRVREPDSDSDESEDILSICAGTPVLFNGSICYDRDDQLIVEPCDRLVEDGYRCKSCYRRYAQAMSHVRCRGYYVVNEIETRKGHTFKVRADYACVSPGSLSIDDEHYPGRCRHCVKRIRD